MKTKLLIACMGLFAFSVIFFVFPKLKKPEGRKEKRPNPIAKLLNLDEPYQAQPLPVGDAVKRWTDLEKPFASVLEREMGSMLELVPLQGTISPGELSAFLTRVAKFESSQYVGRRQDVDFQNNKVVYQELSDQLDRWFAEGTDHPSLRYMALFCSRALNDKAGRLEHSEKGLALLNSSDSGWIRFEFLEEMARFAEPKNTRAAWRKEAKAAMPAAFDGSQFDDSELGVLSSRLNLKYGGFIWKSEYREVTDSLLVNENVPDFIAQLADGFTHVEAAWEARGNGWGKDVSKDGRQGFKDHLSAARKSLTASWEAHPELPEASWKMITVSMGKSVEKNEERKWFDRSVAARFDFQNAYKALAHATQPRWGGSVRKLQALADECYATGRYDTNVPFQYFIFVRTIMKDSKLDPSVYRKPEVQKCILDIVEGYDREGAFGGSTIRAGKSYAAAAMVYGERYEDAYELLTSINQTDSDWFNTSDMGVKSGKDYKISATLKGGPEASRYSAMHDMWKREEFTLAKETGRQLLNNSDLTAPVRERLEIEMAMIDASTVQPGDWCPVFSQGTEVDWAGKYHWQLDAEGRLKGVRPLGCGWIPARVSLEEGFEIECKVDYLPGNNPGNSDRAVLFFGRPEWHQYQLLNVRLHYKKNELHVDRGYNIGETTKKCTLSGSDSIRIIVKDSRMSVWVNGEACLENYKMNTENGCGNPLWIGLGDYWSGKFRAKLRFYDIRVKNGVRLPAE